MYHHKLMPDTFDNMIPWEKDIYVNMLIKKVEEENEREQMEASANRAMGKRRGR